MRVHQRLSGLRRITFLRLRAPFLSALTSVYTVHAAPKPNDLTLHLVRVAKDSSYLV